MGQVESHVTFKLRVLIIATLKKCQKYDKNLIKLSFF